MHAACCSGFEGADMHELLEKTKKQKRKRFGPPEAAAQSHEQLGRPADKAYREKTYPYTWSSTLNVSSRTVTVAVSSSK